MMASTSRHDPSVRFVRGGKRQPSSLHLGAPLEVILNYIYVTEVGKGINHHHQLHEKAQFYNYKIYNINRFTYLMLSLE